jgi:TonB family protein
MLRNNRKMAFFSRRSSFWLAALAILSSLFIASPLQSQQDSSGKRRVVERTAPAYPSLARNMALSGVVRVEAVVSPEGGVKAVDIKGGHPVLAQAVVNAVRKWRWEPASHESRESVEVRFSPE